MFREQDAAFFCGRETSTEQLRKAVLSGNLVTVIGASGSGKSSVVQAGLLPELRKQRPPAATWDAVIFTPGDRPYRRLADALIQLLEPSFSEIDQEIEATKLGKALERTRLTVVVTLRAAFYGHALKLRRAFSDRI